MNALEKKFVAGIRTRGMVNSGDRVLVAVSGGPDSMALLSLFVAASPLLHCELVVAHCNFQLRGTDSDNDEDFVRDYALSLGLESVIDKFDTVRIAGELKKSIEETARIQRYTFFEQMLQHHGCNRIATAHHVNDNAETMLFNLFRGVSLPALRGIRAHNGNIIRPLLLFRRDELVAYLTEKGIPSRTDESNASNDYDRNFIRNRVIPVIEERFSHKLLPSLRRLSEQAGELDEFLEGYFEHLCESEPGLSLFEGKLDVKALRARTVFEQKELFKRALRNIGAPVDAQALQKLVDLLGSQPGKIALAGRNVRVLRTANSLFFIHGG